MNSIALEEFIGLRPKCYSLLYNGLVKDNVVVNLEQRGKQKAKGTSKLITKLHLKHEQYRYCLDTLKSVDVRVNMIKSKVHTIATYHINKIALTVFDTKRWIEAFGHYKTSERNMHVSN